MGTSLPSIRIQPLFRSFPHVDVPCLLMLRLLLHVDFVFTLRHIDLVVEEIFPIQESAMSVGLESQ